MAEYTGYAMRKKRELRRLGPIRLYLSSRRSRSTHIDVHTHAWSLTPHGSHNAALHWHHHVHGCLLTAALFPSLPASTRARRTPFLQGPSPRPSGLMESCQSMCVMHDASYW